MNSVILLLRNLLYPFRVIKVYLDKLAGKFRGGKKSRLTFAGRVGWMFFLTCMFFLTLVIVYDIFSEGDELELSYTDYFFRGRIFFLDCVIHALLFGLLSFFVYLGVKTATREQPSLYPEIDQCWASIEKWREKQRLDWSEFNRFLILGPGSTSACKSIHASSKRSIIGPLPKGEKEWMHFFVDGDNVFLHLKEVSNSSDTLSRTGTSGGGSPFSNDPFRTVIPSDSLGIPADDFQTESVSMGEVVEDFQTVDYSNDGFATLGPDDDLDVDDIGTGEIPGGSEATSPDAHEYAEGDDCPTDRIQYVSELICSKTGGEIPFHGVVFVIPFDQFIRKEYYKTIAASVKQDVLEIRRKTDLIFPVIFMFSGMEADEGFAKLQNLMGKSRAAKGRFGAGCKAVDIPANNLENVNLQVEKACTAFETWVFDRWRKPSQVGKALQNKDLYRLLVRIRTEFKPNLTHLYKEVFLWDEAECPEESPDLIPAGCYFASTGEGPTERGFIAGALGKCSEFTSSVGWGKKKLERDSFLSTLATISFALSFLTITGAISFVILKAVGIIS